jgi:hypothetical protein
VPCFVSALRFGSRRPDVKQAPRKLPPQPEGPESTHYDHICALLIASRHGEYLGGSRKKELFDSKRHGRSRTHPVDRAKSVVSPTGKTTEMPVFLTGIPDFAEVTPN